MSSYRLCKSCGIPVRIGKDHKWNPDGTITQSRDPDHRMIFFDSEGIDGLFSNIEKLIGMPIEKIVIESKARATGAYISHLLRGFRGTAARIVGLGRIVQRVVNQGRVMGYGDIKAVEVKWKEMIIDIEISGPYSLSLFCGDMRGSTEAIRKLEGMVSYEKIEDDTYKIKGWHEPHAPELAGRLLPEQPPRKPGNVKYNRCPRCRVPLEISQFKWNLEKGTIIHEPTDLRYAIFGPAGLQAIFDELERELGGTIPETIIEAQRMHAEHRMSEWWSSLATGDLGNWLAVQGMGNLVSLEEIEGGFTGRIENPAVPLVLLGTSIALFEYMFKSKTDVEWHIAEDGDLVVSIRRKA